MLLNLHRNYYSAFRSGSRLSRCGITGYFQPGDVGIPLIRFCWIAGHSQWLDPPCFHLFYIRVLHCWIAPYSELLNYFGLSFGIIGSRSFGVAGLYRIRN